MTYDKIFLIASKIYSEQQIKMYNALDYSNACIVRFNKICKSQSKIFNGIYHIRFLRGFVPHILSDYRIFGNYNRNATHYIYKNVDEIKKVNKLPNVLSLDKLYRNIPRVDNDTCNSLGYTAYYLLSKQYPDVPIYLIGFTFLPNSIKHSGNKEKEIMLANPKVILIE